MKDIILQLIKKPSVFFFIFFTIYTFDQRRHWEINHTNLPGPFYQDVYEYYTYLPALFSKNENLKVENFKNNKRTIGMAILYLPGFVTGQMIAKIKELPQDGFSEPYQQSIRWWSIIFCGIGLFFCRKNLLIYFNETITTITLFSIFFGTNLFHYTYSWGEMPHSYLFSLYSIYIFLVINFIKNSKNHYLPAAAFIAGFSTLIRPTDILIIIFPLLYSIYTIKDFSARITKIFSNKILLITSIICFLIPILLQIYFWKSYNGKYIYYSYGEEKFFFNDPQIINFTLSYRKGWLLYTPIMLFAIVGILISLYRKNDFTLFSPIYLIICIYILSSWWEWSYGGSFGCRPIIQSYAFLAFPFGYFLNHIWQFNFLKIFNKVIITIVILVLIKFNLFQSWQYKNQVIHWSGMTKKIYWQIFLRDNISEKELKYLHAIAKTPDPSKAIMGYRDE